MDLVLPTPQAVLRITLFTLTALAAVMALTRASGLRSFSKMSGVDFASTIAVGSILATIILPSAATFLEALLGLTLVFVFRHLVTVARSKIPGFESLVDNSPRLLMRDGKIDENALHETNVTREDLIAKLREANVLHFAQVRAVVLESTGDVSVLHGEVEGPALEAALLEGVA